MPCCPANIPYLKVEICEIEDKFNIYSWLRWVAELTILLSWVIILPDASILCIRQNCLKQNTDRSRRQWGALGKRRVQTPRSPSAEIEEQERFSIARGTQWHCHREWEAPLGRALRSPQNCRSVPLLLPARPARKVAFGKVRARHRAARRSQKAPVCRTTTKSHASGNWSVTLKRDLHAPVCDRYFDSDAFYGRCCNDGGRHRRTRWSRSSHKRGLI